MFNKIKIPIALALLLSVFLTVNAVTEQHSTAQHKIKFPYINSAMINELKQNPNILRLFYNRYHQEFKKQLGPAFYKLNSDGVKLVFSSIVSYRSAPYGPSKASESIRSILKSDFLNCYNYPLLTWRYFKILAPKSKIEIRAIGWNGGYVGNHQQLFATKTGVPLLLDPTLGIIATTTFDHVASGKPLKPSQFISAYSRNDVNAYLKKVKTALLKGLYKPSDLLYYFVDYDSAQRQNIKANWATPQYSILIGTIRNNKKN